MPGSPVHLIRRFFDYLTSASLSPTEVETVRSWATKSECALFFAQGRADQRHGYEAAISVLAGGGDDDVVRAALLHDVAKRHARLGAFGRSMASVLIWLNIPVSARIRTYVDHGEVGAVELTDAGSADLVIAFARYHHGVRPAAIDEPTWALLQRADDPPNAIAMVRRPLSWLIR